MLLFAALAVAVTGCGQSKAPAPESPAPVAAATPPDDAAAQAAAAQAAAEAKAAELAAKENELADRETALKQKELEAELAKRDAETAAAAAAAAKKDAAAQQAAAKKASAAKPATAGAAAATPQAAPPAPPILVPAGTQLAIEVVTPLSTKTNKVGDSVDARLASDLMVGDRRAAKAGASVHGTVTQVISGSNKIGGIPTLGVTFDSLVANGTSVSINAPFTKTAKSETGKDTAKIIGGAAAGAIIGHQVSSKNGAVVGGLLGGGAGTAVAHETGGEAKLAAGKVITVATQSSFEARP
jgi:FKBP-type peptidyl-prolyl cis-trans isomerase